MTGPDAARERKRRVLLLVLLAVAVAAAALTYWPTGTPAGGSVTALAPGRPARAETSIDPATLPALKLDQGRGEMEGEVGRNVFRFHDSPTPTKTPVPPTPTPPTYYEFPQAPTPIPPTPTITPIIPPNIPYKAIGIFGPKERPIVVLEDGGRLINAREKDTLDDRFIIRKINRESIDFAFVGLPPDITRRIPVP